MTAVSPQAVQALAEKDPSWVTSIIITKAEALYLAEMLQAHACKAEETGLYSFARTGFRLAAILASAGGNARLSTEIREQAHAVPNKENRE